VTDARARRGRPRVLRIISRLNVGGPARHVVILNSGLEKRGFDTLLVYGTVGADEGSFDHLASECGIASRRVSSLGRRLHLLDDMRAFGGVWSAIREFQPDIVHTHTAKAGALGRAAAWIRNTLRRSNPRIVVVHTFHGHVLEGYFSGIGDRFARSAERALSRATDCTIAISEGQRQALVERFRVADAARTVVVPLGLQLDDLLSLTPEQRARARAAESYGDEFVVGYVGRLVPVKQVEVLIDAMAIVRKELPRARLVIAGDGPERSALAERAATAIAAGLTSFLGWREDLTAVYAPLDVLALTSRNEGTPVALIEAMAAGIPVAATAVGGVPDVVAHGRTGLLTGKTAADVASALLSIARDRAAAAVRAVNARESVRSTYSDTALVDRIARLYEHLLRNRSASTTVRARLHEPA